MAGGEFVISVLLASLFLPFIAAQDIATSCETCDKSACPKVDKCPSGLTKDVCGCCDVCARGLGQLCDLEEEEEEEKEEGKGPYGKCGEYLTCTRRTDLKNSKEATCQCEEEGKVCGSDGVTYLTLCDLLARVPDHPDLTVAARGICLAPPSIRSRPEDMARALGSILVMDCEAVGYPVPAITWMLNKKDGTSYQLPGDDPSFAVQTRGGPESGMVTGWVQIMKVTPETLGVYTCLATNSEGEAQASATLTQMKPDVKDHENMV